jgi:hypothetical protein
VSLLKTGPEKRVFKAVAQSVGGDLVGFLKYSYASIRRPISYKPVASPQELIAWLVESVTDHFPRLKMGQAGWDKSLALRADAFLSDGQLTMRHRHFKYRIPALSANRRGNKRMSELVAMFNVKEFVIGCVVKKIITN